MEVAPEATGSAVTIAGQRHAHIGERSRGRAVCVKGVVATEGAPVAGSRLAVSSLSWARCASRFTCAKRLTSFSTLSKCRSRPRHPKEGPGGTFYESRADRPPNARHTHSA